MQKCVTVAKSNGQAEGGRECILIRNKGWGGVKTGRKGNISNETFPPSLPVHRYVTTDVHLVVFIVGVIVVVVVDDGDVDGDVDDDVVDDFDDDPDDDVDDDVDNDFENTTGLNTQESSIPVF